LKTFIRSAKYFLVQNLKISNKEAIEIISTKRLLINGKFAGINQEISSEDAIILDGTSLQEPKYFRYIAFYKPRGIETTLNKDIPDNLIQCFKCEEKVFPVGRLDKESEGLLLLTNNGILFNKIIDGNSDKEKEYEVVVDKELTPEAIERLSKGICILGKQTKEAIVEKLDRCKFKIILTEGMNRQIRRMCFKLGYQVLELKRTRIVNISIGNLNPGECRNLTSNEIQELKNSIQN
jgi:23S rRNA pseudouridine2604 synthase